MPQVDIGTNPSQQTWLRSAWYKVLTEDYSTAKKHFQLAGDHPWSRLGLGYLARLRLDHTRTKSLLESLRNRPDDVGELARWWSQSPPNRVWSFIPIESHRQTHELAPNFAIARHGFSLIETKKWASASVTHTTPQNTARHVQYGRFYLQQLSSCVRLEGPEMILVRLNGDTIRKRSTRTILVDILDPAKPIETLWTGDIPPRVYESPKTCDSFSARTPPFLVPSEDGLLGAFIKREVALMQHDHMKVLEEKPSVRLQSSAPFVLQTLTSLRSVGTSWHEERMKIQSLFASPPAPLIALNMAIQAYRLKNFEDAWGYLQDLIQKHDDDRKVLYWGIKTLLALQRDNETPSLSKRYLSLGTPDCDHLDVVFGPLGETNANVHRLIEADLACHRLENAVERTLRWYRFDKAKEILSVLRQTAGTEHLTSRLLIALNRVEEAIPSLMKYEPVKYHDLNSAQENEDLITQLLPKLVDQFPNSHTAMQLNAWLPDASRPIGPGKITLAQDHVNARVLSQAKVTRINKHGHGHLVHEERLRINNVLAARNYAEIGVPEDAIFPFVEVEKPSGVTSRPLDIAEKGTFSLPNLDVGDIITVQYILPISEHTEAEHIGPPKLRLELPYAPVDYSSFVFIHPVDSDWTLTRTEPSEAVTETVIDDSRVSSWINEDLPRLWRERHSAEIQFRGNFIRLHEPDVIQSFLKSQAEIFLRHRVKRYPWISPACAPSRFDLATQRALTQQINTWLRSPFTRQLTALEFSGIISQCLHRMGVSHRIALLSPWANQSLPGPLNVEAHTHPIFLLEEKKFWDPIGYQLPPHLVPHALRNTSGYIIFPFSELGDAYHPPSPDQDDEVREITLSLNTHTDGYLTGEVTDQINGVSAYLLRQQLLPMSTNELRQFIRQQIGRFSPLARLKEVNVQALEDTRVSLRYTFTLEHPKTVELSAFAQRLNSTFTNDFKRTTDLFIDEPINQRLRLIVHKSVGQIIRDPIDRSYASNRFVVERSKTDQQEFVFTLQIPRQRIPKSEFDAFKQWCIGVEALESIKIKKRGKTD